MRKFLILIFLLLLTWLSALDTICKISGEEIECEIMKITGDQINFKLPTDKDGFLKTISKYDVSSIKYANGKVVDFKGTRWDDVREFINSADKKLFIFVGSGRIYPKDKSDDSHSADISVVNDNGFILGVKREIRVGHFFSLAPEISVARKKFKTEFDVNSGFGLTYLNISETVNQLQIPIFLEIHTDYSSYSKYYPYFAFGPQINFTLSHKMSYEMNASQVDGMSEPESDFKTFSYDLVFNSGININTGNVVNSVDISLRYCLGLSKSFIKKTGLTPESTTKFNSLFLTVGVEL